MEPFAEFRMQEDGMSRNLSAKIVEKSDLTKRKPRKSAICGVVKRLKTKLYAFIPYFILFLYFRRIEL